MDPFDFTALARRREPPLDRLALAVAEQFRAVDVAGALEALDSMGLELLSARTGPPATEVELCSRLLAERHGFAGDRERYADPANSMLDLVLERRRGLPILLSVVYVEVGRRAGVPLAGVGLPGHYVVGHFGTDPPLLLDPFAGGHLIEPDVPRALVRPWGPHETALRMLNNLVASYSSRGDVGASIHAARLRLALPLDETARETLELEQRRLEARLN